MAKNRSRILAILLIFGVGLVVWLSLRPAKGTIRVIKNTESIQSQTAVSKDRDYSGQIFKFSYPGSYDLQTASDNRSDYLDRVVLLGSARQSKKITVAAAKTQAGSLSDVPAVQARRLKPETYSESPFDLSGSSGILFSKTDDSFELTGLVIRDRSLVTVSLTSSSTGSTVAKEYNDDFHLIVSSWQWKYSK